MNSEHLLQAIGEVNDEAVRDACYGQPLGQRRSLRRVLAVALAAALMLAMSVTAVGYFSGAAWFKDFFSDRSGEELTHGQQQFIDNNAVGIGQRITQGGCTVTVESAITDGRNAYVKLNIAMPEGTVLDASSYFFDDYSFKSSNPVKHPTGSSGGSWPLLDDGDGKANTISVMLSMYVTVPEGSGFSFADGYERTLTLRNLCTRQEDYPYDKITVTEGEWVFRFTLTGDDSETELLTEPVTLSGTRMMGDALPVSVHSMRITAMGLVFNYTFFEGDTPEAVDFGPATIVMKDGSSAAIWPKSGGISGPADGTYDRGECMYRFDAPIDLTEAEYICFSDGTIIPIQ